MSSIIVICVLTSILAVFVVGWAVNNYLRYKKMSQEKSEATTSPSTEASVDPS